jgi:hypothetical protein
MRVLTDTDQLTVRQCQAPDDEGLIMVDGVRVCGRRHFRVKLLRLETHAKSSRLGGQ